MDDDRYIAALAQAEELVASGEQRELLRARGIAFRETMLTAPELKDIIYAEGSERELIVLQADVESRIFRAGGPTLDQMEIAWIRFEDWKVWYDVSDDWALQVLREFVARYVSNEGQSARTAED